MVYWNKTGATRKRGPYNTRGKYTKKPFETRGKTVREPFVMKYFWQYHTMDEMITCSPEQIDNKIDEFFLVMEAKKIKRDPTWWYPEKIAKGNFI